MCVDCYLNVRINRIDIEPKLAEVIDVGPCEAQIFDVLQSIRPFIIVEE